MAQAIDLSAISADRVRLSLRLWPILAVSLLFVAGCIPSQQTVPSEELPLSPIVAPDRPVDPGLVGQQEASLKLTDQGRRHLMSGRVEEAVSVFQKAISIFPSNPYAYYYLGKVRYLKKEYPQSLPALGQAELFLSGDRIWLSRVYALRGQTYEALSRFEEAQVQYRQALSSDSRNPEAREGIERLKSRQTR